MSRLRGAVEEREKMEETPEGRKLRSELTENVNSYYTGGRLLRRWCPDDRAEFKKYYVHEDVFVPGCPPRMMSVYWVADTTTTRVGVPHRDGAPGRPCILVPSTREFWAPLPGPFGSVVPPYTLPEDE